MKKKKEERVELPLKLRTDPFPFFTDPFGSYTGRTLERGEVPMQDADDL